MIYQSRVRRSERRGARPRSVENRLSIIAAPGADVNVRDFDQRTPLHLAAAEDHGDVVALLLMRGAKVDVKDRWGCTPCDDCIPGDGRAPRD